MPAVIGRIDIRNARSHDDMSEETLAYSADIFIDGRKAGTIKNDGRGGCDMPSFSTRQDRDTFDAEMSAWGKRHNITFEPDAAFVRCVAFGAVPSDFVFEGSDNA